MTDTERLNDIHDSYTTTGTIGHDDVMFLFALAIACDCRLDALIQAVKQ